MARHILVRPVVTEKSEIGSSKRQEYTFVVDKNANKIEIKKAVEEMFSVTVDTVNTAIIPGKYKSRNTRTGVVKGVKPGYKKAFVKLVEGEKIDLFGDETENAAE